MATISCKQYRITLSKEHILAVLVDLELMKAVEPTEPLFPYFKKTHSSLIRKLDKKVAKYHAAIEFLAHFREKQPQKTLLDAQATKKLQKDIKKYNTYVKTLLADKETLENLEKELLNLEKEKNIFELIKDVDLNIFVESSLLGKKVIKATKEEYQYVKDLLASVPGANIEKLAGNDEEKVGLIVYDASFEKAITQVLNKAQVVSLNGTSYSDETSPAKIYKELHARYQSAHKEKETLVAKLKEESHSKLLYLGALHDMYKLLGQSLGLFKYVGYSIDDGGSPDSMGNASAQALKELSAHDASLVAHVKQSKRVHVDGWIVPEKVAMVQSRLRKIDSTLSITEVPTLSDEAERTSISNNALFKPFELITGLMGMPSAEEEDPTPFIAPFFVIFFGFALGDAGYGLLMTIASLILLKTHAKTAEIKEALKLILYCGIATVVFGALTGGWFGADLDALGGLGNALKALKVVDLQSKIIEGLVFTLILGFVHQIYGLSIKFMGLVKQKNLKEAVYHPGTWIFLLLSLAFAGALGPLGLTHLKGVSNILLAVSGVLFMWGQGYPEKSLIKRPFMGLAAIFNITGYLSNVLSYARLLALGLATGVIAGVVNLLAGMAGGAAYIGPLLAVVVLVVGHIFNLVLNLLGTSVNVARLHLVEFFPRFFEAKGTKMDPVQADSTYIEFSDNVSFEDIAGFGGQYV